MPGQSDTTYEIVDDGDNAYYGNFIAIKDGPPPQAPDWLFPKAVALFPYEDEPTKKVAQHLAGLVLAELLKLP